LAESNAIQTGKPAYIPALRSYLDSIKSSSDFISRKCDKMATNVDRATQRTLLAAAVSIWLSSYSTTVDRDATGEDGPSTLSNATSQKFKLFDCILIGVPNHQIYQILKFLFEFDSNFKPRSVFEF
jgi:hypothetical protein